MALTFFIFAPWIAEHIINAPQLASLLRIGSIILFISALNGVQTGVLSGFEAFKNIARVNFFAGLLSFPILIAGAYFWGLVGVAWALVINLCFNWFFGYQALRKEVRLFKTHFNFKKYSRELSVLWKFSLPAVLAGLLVGLVTWACNAMLVNQPNGYEEMGVLTAALIFQGLLLFVNGMLNAPLLSMVSNAGIKMPEKLEKANILSTWILGVIVAIPLLCFPELAQIMFSKGYDTYSFKATFSLVVFCTTILMFKAGLARVLTANNLLWWGFLSNACWAAILIVATVFLVHWGALGLAISLTIAYMLNTVMFMPLYYSRKLVPKRMFISFESVIIWLILIVLVSLNIADVPLFFRAIVFIPCFVLTGIAFNRLMRGGCLKGSLEHES